MPNIYGHPGESIQEMNRDRFSELHKIDKRYHAILKQIHDWDVWIEWEIVVARILEDLAIKDSRYSVIHDVRFDGGNIDHIVVFDNRIVIIVETKASSYLFDERKVVKQVTWQWDFLKKRLWIKYIKSFVCLSRSDKKFHETKEGIEVTDLTSLEAEIRSCITNQVQYHNNEHPENKELIKDLIKMKGYH